MSKNSSAAFMSFSSILKPSMLQQIPSSIHCSTDGCAKIGLMRCKCDSSRAFCPSHFEQHSHKKNAQSVASSSDMFIFPKISFSSNITNPFHNNRASPETEEHDLSLKGPRPSSAKEVYSSKADQIWAVPTDEPEIISAPVLIQNEKEDSKEWMKETEIAEEKDLVIGKISDFEIIASPLLSYEEAKDCYYKTESSYKINPRKQPRMFLCGCKKNNKAYSEEALVTVSKFIGFGKTTFNENEQFHVDLLVSVLKNLDCDWNRDLSKPIRRLTLSMTLRDALSQQGSLITLFALLYFHKHFSSKLIEILGKHKDKPFYLACLMITQSFLPLLEKQKIQVLHQDLDKIMQIYSGMIVRWFYLYEEESATWNTAFLVTRKLMKKAVLNLQSILAYVN